MTPSGCGSPAFFRKGNNKLVRLQIPDHAGAVQFLDLLERPVEQADSTEVKRFCRVHPHREQTNG